MSRGWVQGVCHLSWRGDERVVIMSVKDFVAGSGAMIYFSIEREEGRAYGSCCNLLNFSASFSCSSFYLFFLKTRFVS